jgi:hypothetical protein
MLLVVQELLCYLLQRLSALFRNFLWHENHTEENTD